LADSGLGPAFVNILATLTPRIEFCSNWTNTLETTRSILALPSTAQKIIKLHRKGVIWREGWLQLKLKLNAERLAYVTLIDIKALLPRSVNLKTRFTDTSKSPWNILTSSSRSAGFRDLGTLIDVWERGRAQIVLVPQNVTYSFLTVTAMRHPRPMWTEEIKFGCVRHWTSSAWYSPTHWLSKNNRAAATGRPWDGSGGRRSTNPITVLGITQIPLDI